MPSARTIGRPILSAGLFVGLFALALTSCGKLKSETTGSAGAGGGGGSAGAGGTSVDGGGGTSAAGSPGDDGGADTNTDVHADCGAVMSLPPIITVVNAATGASLCEPTFKVEGPDGGSVGSLDGMPLACGQTTDFDCPAARSDGGAVPCSYALLALLNGSYQVEVSKPGFAPAVVSVTNGARGCVPYVPSTHPTVSLHPLSDAATDTATDAATDAATDTATDAAADGG